MNGGYDEGYRACECFWGTEPGSLVKQITSDSSIITNWNVLDAGCGEGKNAAYLAERGAKVIGIDLSPLAISNAVRTWGRPEGINWIIGRVEDLRLEYEYFDLIVAYGLLHCMPNRQSITSLIQLFKLITIPGGLHIICAFNKRNQDLRAHPGLNPTLLAHNEYSELYSDWITVHESDKDLWEIHPNNKIKHVHSLTRLIVRQP